MTSRRTDSIDDMIDIMRSVDVVDVVNAADHDHQETIMTRTPPRSSRAPVAPSVRRRRTKPSSSNPPVHLAAHSINGTDNSGGAYTPPPHVPRDEEQDGLRVPDPIIKARLMGTPSPPPSDDVVLREALAESMRQYQEEQARKRRQLQLIRESWQTHATLFQSTIRRLSWATRFPQSADELEAVETLTAVVERYESIVTESDRLWSFEELRSVVRQLLRIRSVLPKELVPIYPVLVPLLEALVKTNLKTEDSSV